MRMQSYTFRALAAALLLAGAAPVLAQSTTETQPRYAPWDATQQNAQNMLKELKALIDEAERSRASGCSRTISRTATTPPTPRGK